MQGTSITALLPDLQQSAGEHAALIDAATALAVENGCSLDLVQLCGPGDDAQEPKRDSIVTSAIRWQARHATAAGHDDATVLAVLFDAALDMIDRAAAPASPNAAHRRRICLLPPGPLGDEIAATLAARRGGTSLGRCEALDLDGDHVIAHKQAFGGRIAAAVSTAASQCFATLHARPRKNSYAGIGAEAETSAISQAAEPDNVRRIELAVELPPEAERSVLPNADALPRLEGARAVVSGAAASVARRALHCSPI
jgi:electron transfer flavoprotein alpha subunit